MTIGLEVQQSPDLKKKLLVEVVLSAGQQSTRLVNDELNNRPFHLFSLADYLKNNAVKSISLIDYSRLSGMDSAPEYPVTYEPNLNYYEERADVCNKPAIEFHDWYYNEHDFQFFCDVLKKASNLECITFNFFDPSSEYTAPFIAAIQNNPSIRVQLRDCGESLIKAMQGIKKERFESVKIMDSILTRKIKNPDLPTQQPFAIEDIDPRIIYGFAAALGLSAIICAFVVLPATLLNPITAAAVTMGSAALALGVCGLFSSVKSREPKEDSVASTLVYREIPSSR